MKKNILLIIIIVQSSAIFSQGIVIGAVNAMQNRNKPYLTKTKVLDRYPLYQTINNFDFKGKIVSIEFKDLRDSLNLNKVECSKFDIKNETEFSYETGSHIVKAYLDSLFVKSKFIINQNENSEKVVVKLNVLDCKKTGFMTPQVHGICQMFFGYRDFKQTYCIDLQDGQTNSPIGRTTVITIKEAKEILICASIREVIELFLKDFKTYNNKL